MGLWCGCAVLPFPSFDLVFLFHLLGQVALALVTFFALSLLSRLYFFCFSFLPFRLDLFGLGVFVPFRRLLFSAFALTSSSSFLRDFLLPPGSGLLRRSSLLFFFFEVFLSAFEISFSSRPFFSFGGEVWLGPSVFGPALGSVTLLLALGRFVLLSLPGPLAVQLRFYSACGSDRTLEFLHCEEVSGGPQVVLILGHSAGAAAPCLFHAGACGLLGEVFLFCLSFLRLRFPFYGFF